MIKILFVVRQSNTIFFQMTNIKSRSGHALFQVLLSFPQIDPKTVPTRYVMNNYTWSFLVGDPIFNLGKYEYRFWRRQFYWLLQEKYGIVFMRRSGFGVKSDFEVSEFRQWHSKNYPASCRSYTDFFVKVSKSNKNSYFLHLTYLKF